MADRVKVVVAGVPRSYQSPHPDGTWLTNAHIEQIRAVSPLVELIHSNRVELEFASTSSLDAEVLLIEASGKEPYGAEVSVKGVAKLVTPNLKWVQTCSSGVGHILELELLPASVLITNAAGVHANALGESGMSAILFHAKRLRERLENQAAKKWQELHCTELREKTIGIIGLGSIGCRVAALAKAFGMTVLGIRRNVKSTENCDMVGDASDLHIVLSQSDYVVIACPLTAETDGMIGEREFERIKPESYLINLSRGKVVKESSMIAALRSGKLSGAFLDAHVQEPLPADHPLWETRGATIIPHDSHSSPYIGDNIVSLFCENLERYLSGERLKNVIDPNLGY